jgi:hypothetical protein
MIGSALDHAQQVGVPGGGHSAGAAGGIAARDGIQATGAGACEHVQHHVGAAQDEAGDVYSHLADARRRPCVLG